MSKEEIALELVKYVYENEIRKDKFEMIDCYFHILEKFKKVGKI